MLQHRRNVRAECVDLILGESSVLVDVHKMEDALRCLFEFLDRHSAVAVLVKGHDHAINRFILTIDWVLWVWFGECQHFRPVDASILVEIGAHPKISPVVNALRDPKLFLSEARNSSRRE